MVTVKQLVFSICAVFCIAKYALMISATFTAATILGFSLVIAKLNWQGVAYFRRVGIVFRPPRAHWLSVNKVNEFCAA